MIIFQDFSRFSRIWVSVSFKSNQGDSSWAKHSAICWSTLVISFKYYGFDLNQSFFCETVCLHKTCENFTHNKVSKKSQNRVLKSQKKSQKVSKVTKTHKNSQCLTRWGAQRWCAAGAVQLCFDGFLNLWSFLIIIWV